LIDQQQWQVPAHDVFEFAPRRRRHCLCIPVINEGERIRRQLERTVRAGIADHADIVIADGGSTDGSLPHELLKDRSVRTLLVKKGPGKLSAQLRMAYAYALRQGYEGIVTVDGNGKDSVESVPAFTAALDEGWDLIQGSRYVPGGEAIHTPFLRHWGMKLVHVPVISAIAGFRYSDTTNGFRGYSRAYLLDRRVQPFRDIFDTYELLAWLSVRAPQLGYRVKEVPVRREYPATGKVPTKISPWKGNMLLMRILGELALGRYKPVMDR
jgi:dolichol-phosphate mannosyltransferase